jgi:hypothetical protein
VELEPFETSTSGCFDSFRPMTSVTKGIRQWFARRPAINALSHDDELVHSSPLNGVE